MVLAASGPSQDAEDLAKAKAADCIVLVINRTWELCPTADLLYACDHTWWRNVQDGHSLCNGDRVRQEFSGELWTQNSSKGQAEVIKQFGLKAVNGQHELFGGFSFVPGLVVFAGNSGYQALQIAVQAFASRILLTGIDCRDGHWHPPHNGGLANPDQDRLDRWRDAFEVAAEALKENPVEVINCSRSSAVDAFPKAALADVL